MEFSDKRPVKIDSSFYVVARDPETDELRILKADADDPNSTWSEISLEEAEVSGVF